MPGGIVKELSGQDKRKASPSSPAELLVAGNGIFSPTSTPKKLKLIDVKSPAVPEHLLEFISSEAPSVSGDDLPPDSNLLDAENLEQLFGSKADNVAPDSELSWSHPPEASPSPESLSDWQYSQAELDELLQGSPVDLPWPVEEVGLPSSVVVPAAPSLTPTPESPLEWDINEIYALLMGNSDPPLELGVNEIDVLDESDLLLELGGISP